MTSSPLPPTSDKGVVDHVRGQVLGFGWVNLAGEAWALPVGSAQRVDWLFDLRAPVDDWIVGEASLKGPL